MKQYIADVEKTGAIYTHSWGDAAVMTAALKLFGSPEQFTNLFADSLVLSHKSLSTSFVVEYSNYSGRIHER